MKVPSKALLETSDPTGSHRSLEPVGVLPQAAWRLDARPELWPDEVRVRLERLNLDAASFRQLRTKHAGNGEAVRAEVLDIVRTRGKLQNPVTGSGGMLVGTVDQVGPRSSLGLVSGDRVATLVSLSLTPLVITDELRRWDGETEQARAEGHAILFGRSVAARLPDDLPTELALSVLDVCGAPALTARIVSGYRDPVVTVLGAAGKSGSLSAAAARRAGASRVVGVVPHREEALALEAAGLVDAVVVADATESLGLHGAVSGAGGPGDVTVVCVDVPGCEHGAVLATRDGGTVVFFSMATSFTAAALGAEGLGADVTLLIGNGFVPGHSAMALDLVREEPGVRGLFEARR